MAQSNNIISNEVIKFINERRNDLRYNDNLRITELFSDFDISENDNEITSKVQFLIKNNQWEKQNPKAFRDSLLKSKHQMMLTDYTETELSQMKLFKLKGFNIGYALKNHVGKPFSEIVALHNNEPNVHGIGDLLIESAISNGGCYLDHFDVDILNRIYGSHGFIEYDRDKYNPEYDKNGEFKNRYGEKDVIYRKKNNC